MNQPAFDFDEDSADDPSDFTYTVGELAEAINDCLHGGFGGGVWVRGEIDDMANRGPHTYFSLSEDGDNGRAIIRVQLFAPAKKRLKPLLKRHRLDLQNGMKVRVRGTLDFWAPRGQLGLKIFELDPRYTLGELAQSRDATLRRLVANGLIDRNKKTSLSPIPLRIGVATSVESAAWADFYGELQSSQFAFLLKVADTRVQGAEADRMIAGSIGTLARDAHVGGLDAIVVVRGGGARNELAAFDSEIIAHTIAHAPVPVLTGIGHEIDRSIADEAAHTTYKTPTAVAVALIDRVGRYIAAAEAAWQGIKRAGTESSDRAELRLSNVARRIADQTAKAIACTDGQISLRATRLVLSAPAILDREAKSAQDTAELLVERSTRAVERANDLLTLMAARVNSVDPTVQLTRGWSITCDDQGRVVRSVADVDNGAHLITRLADGKLTSTVNAIDQRVADNAVTYPQIQ